ERVSSSAQPYLIVGCVDARRIDLDHDLAGAGCWIRCLAVAQHFRPAVLRVSSTAFIRNPRLYAQPGTNVVLNARPGELTLITCGQQMLSFPFCWGDLIRHNSERSRRVVYRSFSASSRNLSGTDRDSPNMTDPYPTASHPKRSRIMSIARSAVQRAIPLLVPGRRFSSSSPSGSSSCSFQCLSRCETEMATSDTILSSG